MKKNDFEYVKERFDRAAPQMTGKMDSAVLRRRILESGGQKVVQIRRKKRSYKPLAAVAALAACLAVAITAATMFLQPGNTPQVENPGASTPQSDNYSDVPYFKSYDDLNARVQQTSPPEMGCYSGGQIKRFDDAAQSSPAMADGDYIYYAYHNSNYDFPNGDDGYGRNKIYIYKAEGENVKLVNIMNDVFKDSYDLYDLYVKNGRMVVSADDDDAGITRTKIYDVSDPENPKIISETGQSSSGSIRTFVVENTVYIFAPFTVTSDQNTVPFYSENGETKLLNPNDIYYLDTAASSQYVVISAIDAQSGKVKDAKAMFGAGYIMDCVGNDVFISENDESSDIIKVSMNGKNIRFHSAKRSEIPSFDTYENLIEVADNKYLSFSYQNTENGNIATLYSAKNGELTVLDSIKLENIYVNAADNCDEVIANNGYFVLPSSFELHYGIITVSVQDDKIVITNEFENDDKNEMYAGWCATIGNYVYSFNINDLAPDDEKLKVFAYKVNS
ncbi:MAG: beta-propeller domain-containing protein [Clostridiales bacterium]|nr:beta-propeller domain-containing protein [Clostridiales bacterium]